MALRQIARPLASAGSNPNQNPLGVGIGPAVSIQDGASLRDLEVEAVQALLAVCVALPDRRGVVKAAGPVGPIFFA